MKPIQEKPVAATRKMSGGGKVALGCGAVGCGFTLLLCSGIAILSWVTMGYVADYSEQFVAKGYETETRQIIQIVVPPEAPVFYKCQVLETKCDIDVDIAAACQVMVVNNRIDGDIDFLGQVLEIKPGGVVTGDIRVDKGQVIINRGTIMGQISGTYQAFDGKPPGGKKAIKANSTATESSQPPTSAPLDIPLGDTPAESPATPPSPTPQSSSAVPPSTEPPSAAPPSTE